MNGPTPRLPQTPAAFRPPLSVGDILRTLLLGLALFGVAFVVLREVAAGITTPGARVNYLLGYFAAWSFSWLAAIWIVLVRWRGLTFADLGYTVPDRVWGVRGILFAFAALPLAYGLLALLRPVLGASSSASLQQFFGGADFTLMHAGVVLLYGGFLVPLAEEMIFRGLLFRWLRQRFDFWPSALISASAFGLAHLRLDQTVIATALGLPLAWLYERSRSLAPSILMHQTYNSLVLMLTYAVIWLPPGREG